MSRHDYFCSIPTVKHLITRFVPHPTGLTGSDFAPTASPCRHGDLKAGNVLLTAGSITSPGQRGGSDEEQQRAAEVWAQAGSLPLTAKVADFGLAMPLGPSDTHATMLARVSVAG